jgi:hypothetical protein
MHACFSNWFYDIFNVAFDYMPEKHQNKALCVLNFSGRFGGAEKRYATLFNHLMVQGADYYLIMNTRLYRLLVNSFLLRASERIILFNDGGRWHSTGSCEFKEAGTGSFPEKYCKAVFRTMEIFPQNYAALVKVFALFYPADSKKAN